MKKLAWFALLVFVCTAGAQTTSQITVVTPTVSKYGYPVPVLAGSDRNAFVTVFAETDRITHISGDGNKVTFTAINTLSKGDIINLRKFTSVQYSARVWQVAAVTPTSFSIEDDYVGNTDEPTGYLQKIAGANFKSTGTWEILNTATPAGGPAETFRLFTQDGSKDTGFVEHPVLTNAVAHINYTVGPYSGKCVSTGSTLTGDLAFHSTREFDLKFTSDDDPNQVSIVHVPVCSNGGGTGLQGVAHVTPGYRQVYKGRYIPLTGQVFGNTNQWMDWTITAAPAGGNATLLFSSYPQPVFYSGSVSGQYEVTGCPAVDHTPAACDRLAVWVSPNQPPLANTDRVEQVPCDVDTVANPTVIEVGPGQQYGDLLSIPQNYAAPLLVRIHNNGPDGNPTQYHSQVQVDPPSSGTWDHRHPAFVMCGVPNPRTGELPIMSGDGATPAPWASEWLVAPYGLVSVNGIHAGPHVNDGRIKFFHHVTISGIHLKDVTRGVTFIDTTGQTAEWGGSMGFRPFGIQYWSVIGTFAENVATPYFDDCNAQQGWDACSLDTFYEGNRAVDYGIQGQSTEHMFYTQALRDTVLLNRQEGVKPGGQGTSAYSDRGTRSFHMYNSLMPQAGRETGTGPGGHSEMQDAYNYILPDEYWGYLDWRSCNTLYSEAPGCLGAFGGMDWYAAMAEEHNNAEFTIGNAYYSIAGGSKYLGIATTHGTLNIDNAVQGFYSFNTFLASPAALNSGQSLFEDVRLSPQPDDAWYLPAVWPRGFFQNNIIPWKDNRNCAYTCTIFGYYGHTLMSFQTNLIAPGQVTVQPNIHPTGWKAGGLFINGFNTSYQFFDGWNIDPINQNLGGFVSQNFIPYTIYPVDSNMVPFTNSNARGAATPLTGQLAYYPPRFNAVDQNMNISLRADLSTVGAYDPGTAQGTQTSPPITDSQSSTPVTGSPIADPPATTPGTPAATSTVPGVLWLTVGQEGDRIAALAGQIFRFGSPVSVYASGAVGSPSPEAWSAPKTITTDGSFTANNSLFGDPIVGVVKVVQVQLTTTSRTIRSTAPPSTVPAQQWLTIGGEGAAISGLAGQTFRFGSPASIYAYNPTGSAGAPSPEAWSSLMTLATNGSFVASNTLFGDPIVGVLKVIQIQLSSLP